MDNPNCACCFIDTRALLIGMLLHSQIIGVIVDMHVRDGESKLVFFAGMKCDGIARPRHIFPVIHIPAMRA